MIVQNLLLQNELKECRGIREDRDKMKFKTEYLLARFAVDKFYNGKLVSFNSKLDEILDAAWEIGNKKKISPMMAMMIVHTESRGNPNAISNKLCYGITQVNYKVWHKELNIDIARIFEIPYNMELGLEIFKGYLEMCKGNAIDALKMYNGGPGGMQYTGTYANDVVSAFNAPIIKVATEASPIGISN
jgi:soluble lytic murein transglycosylase-like protein